MSLDLAKLENLIRKAGKTTAACPACREEGADKSGDHLVIFDNGRFGCAVNPKSRKHNQRIWWLAGDPASLPDGADFSEFTVSARSGGGIKVKEKISFLRRPGTHGTEENHSAKKNEFGTAGTAKSDLCENFGSNSVENRDSGTHGTAKSDLGRVNTNSDSIERQLRERSGCRR
jgi:hypothetical protein